MDYKEIINFWFEEIEPKQWYVKDSDFDQLLRDRFGETHSQVANEETKSWRSTPEGRLAEIIVLDQFSRNMFRDTPEAFTYDTLALRLSKEAIKHGADKELPTMQKSMMYMLFMHSEKVEDHEVAMKLFAQPWLEWAFDYEIQHKKIIDQFGRYPHRNDILGRVSTSEEMEFLKEDGSSF